MSGKVLGYYGDTRDFHCARCGPNGPIGEEATVDTGLDYAREQCVSCGKWVDEAGDESE